MRWLLEEYDERVGPDTILLLSVSRQNSSPALDFRVTSGGKNLAGVTVSFFLDNPWDGSWSLNSPDECIGNATTNSTGVAEFTHTFTGSGTHYVYAYFIGFDTMFSTFMPIPPSYAGYPGYPIDYPYSDWYKPCNVSLAVTVVPLAVLFSISPSEFDPSNPTQLTLNATVMDLRYNNTRYTGSCTVQFNAVDAYNDVTSLGSKTTSTGNATWHVQYPGGNVAYAYEAVASLQGGAIQSLISSPVQLTVGTATRLLLNVPRDLLHSSRVPLQTARQQRFARQGQEHNAHAQPDTRIHE